jgi:protein KRI1
MLLATDKELNEYMSVKKFAPYRHKNKGAWDKDRNAKLQELRKAIAARTWDGVPLGQLNKSQGGHRSKADRNDGSTWDEQKKKKRIGKKERQKQKLLKEGAEANENGGGDPIAAAMAIDDGASERPKKKRKREES